MEKVYFGHLVKNIPVPSKNEYRQMMINSYLRFIRDMRWKALQFLKPFKNAKKETFGFKSLNNPPPIEEIVAFEEDLRDIVFNVEFEKTNDHFQQKLREEKEMIEKEDKLIVSADKTSNFYKVEPEKYRALVKKNVELKKPKGTSMKLYVQRSFGHLMKKS